MELQKNKKQPVRGVFKNSSTYLPSDLDFLKMYVFCFRHHGKKQLVFTSERGPKANLLGNNFVRCIETCKKAHEAH